MKGKLRLVFSLLLTLAMLMNMVSLSFAANGNAIYTTDDKNSININSYAKKSDVYLNGGPQNPDDNGNLDYGSYDVIVTGKGNELLGRSIGQPIEINENGKFEQLYQLTLLLIGETFGDSSNGQYKVEIGNWDVGKWVKYKSDNFSVGHTGTIIIQKVIDGNVVGNPKFTFKITGPNGNVMQREVTYGVTTENAIEINALEFGTYTIEETNVPDGYELKEISPEFVILSEANLNATVTVTNTIKNISQKSSDIAVLKSAAPTTINAGGEVVFTIAATNNGPDDTTGVVIEDSLLAGLEYLTHTASNGTYDSSTGEWLIDTMVDGATETLTITAKALADDPGKTVTVTNTTSVTDQDNPDPDTSNNTSTVTVDVETPETLKKVDIAVTKLITKNLPNANNEVTFHVTTANNGPNGATGVVVTDTLPAGLTYISSIPADDGAIVDVNGQIISWDVGNLAVNERRELLITAKVFLPGTYTNNVIVSDVDQYDTNAANNSASANINATAIIFVAKSVNKSEVLPGETVTYTVSAENTGNMTLTGITLQDSLITAPITFPNLLSDQDHTETYEYTIPSGAAVGSVIINTVTVSTDQNAKDSASASVEVIASPIDPKPGLKVTKTVDVNAAYRGETVYFTVEVENTGNVVLEDIEVEDPLLSNNPINIASLAPGAKAIVFDEAPYKVPTNAGSNITNTATATVKYGEREYIVSDSASVSIRSKDSSGPSEPDKVKLTTSVIGQGDVNPGPGTKSYEKGTVVKLTATPEEGWEFVEWRGDQLDENNKIKMNSNKKVIAVFEEITIYEPEIPGGPAPEPTPEPIPSEPPVVPVEILSEEIPAGPAPTLPQTGGIPLDVFYGIGGIMTAAGFIIRKKRI